MNKKLIVCYFLLMVLLSEAAKARKVRKIYKSPVYRSLEQAKTTAGQKLGIPELPTETKLLVIKPHNNEADEGRFLKHLLLTKRFGQPRPGYTLPYLIINNPLNLTNINKNNLNNVQPAETTTVIGTGTGTGTGTGSGTITGTGTNTNTATTTPTSGTGTTAPTDTSAAGSRLTYLYGTQSLPLPNNAPFHQQRPQTAPQIVYGVPINSGNQNKRKRNRFGNNKNKYPFQNPNNRNKNLFKAFANSLRNFQFF